MCLSGFMRFLAAGIPFQDILKNMMNSFDGIEYDVFISTWNIAGVQRGKIQTYSYRWPEVPIIADTLSSLYGDRLKRFQILPYNPVAITPPWLLQYAHDDMHISQRLCSMYFHLYEANRLKNEYSKEHNIHYDVTIRSRTDLNFHFNKSSEVILASDCKLGQVFVPDCETYGMINDQFMYGESSTMDKVANIYEHIVSKSPTIPHEPADNPLHPAERVLQMYLASQSIEPIKSNIWYTRSS